MPAVMLLWVIVVGTVVCLDTANMNVVDIPREDFYMPSQTVFQNICGVDNLIVNVLNYTRQKHTNAVVVEKLVTVSATRKELNVQFVVRRVYFTI